VSPKEQEVAIGELEERVDRLRTLYEQYFLGFEKLEPSVARKDVDRRFAMLRKEQIRNTAQRYRFNVVTQKYNTYGMYWQRICRQIEEGTFKRHVQRAKRILGDREMKHLAIDVDLADFEDEGLDMDAILREADEAAAAYTNEGGDTVPPGQPSRPAPAPRALATPGATLFIGGRREVVEEEAFPADRPSQPGVRAARPAVLPSGAKQKVLRKIAPGAAMPDASASQTDPGANPGSQPGPSVPMVPQSQPRVAVPLPPASAPRVAMPVPPGAVRSGSAPSAGRMPMASSPQIGPGGAVRAPFPSSPSVGRTPVANPPLPPGARPPVRPAPTSSPSVGRVALPKPPPAGKLPVAPQQPQPEDEEPPPRPKKPG
jgi:hypothetical protein